MKKKIFKLSLIFILTSVLLLLTARLYLKQIYIPNHQTLYNSYVLRENYDKSMDGKFLEVLDPPEGGCFNNCFGIKTVKSCEAYSRKYNNCQISCNGYLYNNCSSSRFGMFLGLTMGLLTK